MERGVIQTMMREVDADGNGTVELSEFSLMVEKAKAFQKGDRSAFLDVVQKVAEKNAHSKSRFARLYVYLKKLSDKLEDLGVKLKILISLFQVLGEMSSTFVIQYPQVRDRHNQLHKIGGDRAPDADAHRVLFRCLHTFPPQRKHQPRDPDRRPSRHDPAARLCVHVAARWRGARAFPSPCQAETAGHCDLRGEHHARARDREPGARGACDR